MPERTVFRVLEEAAEKYGSAPALNQPFTEEGKRKYRTLNWIEYRQAAEEIAAGLRTLDVQKGDIVALNSETRLEFYLADLGIMANGSIAAALYPNYPPKDLLRTVEACRARVLFVENPKTLKQFEGVQVEKFILLTGEAPGAISLGQLRSCGREAIARDPNLLARIKSEVRPTDDAILYLTSGATGEPKMVMVTHRALVSNIDAGPVVLPLTPQDRTVAFLPSAHIAQRVVVELLPIRMGMPVTFSESLMKLPQDLKAVRPTIFLAPPRLWERIYATICTEVKKRPAALQKVFYAGLGLGLAAARHRHRGEPVPARIRVPLAVADRLFFHRVRARFGGKLRFAASGAAPLGADLAEFYEAIGMPLIEGYGLTEGGVVAFNPVDKPKPGSIGKLLPGVELRIADDGELLVKGQSVFSRYYKDPEATADVLRDGWLHTGDIASMDDEGYLFITGRKKELIVSSSGKKVFPSRVENLFKFEPLISQVVLIGDRLPYLTALFTINAAAVEMLDDMKEIQGRSLEDVASAPPVLKEIHKIVSRVNKQLAPFEQVRKYKVLARDFTIEEGELTATMKVRRGRVIENFRAHIDELYAGKEESH
ncbi:MAG: long-chain fatty acid--CoA ligase [Acidobacteria bacterium]|nr:MAG: long-chain fatty acid--CoA ligase [Acidobacteriota bacterium]